MADEMEIIISAVDSASEVFQNIISSVTGMADEIKDSISDVSDDFDNMANNVGGFQDAVSNIDDSTIEELASSLGMSTEEVERLIQIGADIGSIPFNDAAASALELEEATEGSSDAMDGLTAAADAFTATTLLDFAQNVADTLWDLAESAGNFGDSVNRASLEAEGAGISVDDMKNAVSDLSDTTGRAGGQIRESFTKAVARGVTDLDSFKTMMEGAGAQAYLFNTDIQTMGDKFSSLAMKDTLMTKTLAETGITMNDLAEAMGMTGATADEVKDKWKELDTNQRAAILGTAASLNEGKNANEEYKNSWQGLKDQIDIGRGRLERLVGSVILPVLIPAMKAAGQVLDWLGDTLDYVMKSPLGGFVSVIGTAAGVIAIAVPVVAGLSAAMTFFSATIWPAVAASWALISPWLPFIAIGAAIVLIVYEIGKAFGWWTDASSMIDAISAGLQRLWDAFVNHPDVQAAIQAISGAWKVLSQAVGEAWQKVSEFLGLSSGGNFDVVRALIDGIGLAWEGMKTHIELVVGIIQGIIWAFQEVGSAIEWLQEQFDEGWSAIMGVMEPYITVILDLVNNLIGAFDQFKSGQMDLPTLVVTVLGLLWNAYLSVFNMIISFMISVAGQLWSYAVTAGQNVLNGIIQFISQLPGRVYTYLMNVLSRITSAGSQWVSSARSKASSIVSGVGSILSGLPGRISSALSGVVSAITAPFKSAYDSVCNIVNNLKNKVSEGMDYIASLGGAAGGEGYFAAGGETATDLATGNLFNITTGEIVPSESNINVDVNEKITLDLVNVPAHIDTNTLIRALQDREVLKALTGNRDFQELDNQIKTEIMAKTRRANGG